MRSLRDWCPLGVRLWSGPAPWIAPMATGRTGPAASPSAWAGRHEAAKCWQRRRMEGRHVPRRTRFRIVWAGRAVPFWSLFSLSRHRRKEGDRNRCKDSCSCPLSRPSGLAGRKCLHERVQGLSMGRMDRVGHLHHLLWRRMDPLWERLDPNDPEHRLFASVCHSL